MRTKQASKGQMMPNVIDHCVKTFACWAAIPCPFAMTTGELNGTQLSGRTSCCRLPGSKIRWIMIHDNGIWLAHKMLQEGVPDTKAEKFGVDRVRIHQVVCCVCLHVSGDHSTMKEARFRNSTGFRIPPWPSTIDNYRYYSPTCFIYLKLYIVD